MTAHQDTSGLPRPFLQVTVERFGQWVESPPVQRVIITLIVLNGIALGLETAPSIVARFGTVLAILDHLVLSIFVVEIIGKLAYRRINFFKDGWNVFDFIIITIALVPASGPLTVLRALRIIRVLRLLAIVPSMRRVVGALLHAIPGVLSVGSLILLLFYVGAVLATKLFGASFPDWFGTIGLSMYTLFQVMTLESWSMGIVRPVMEQYPYAWTFFVPFIVATSFAILNLFIGIIVDSMQTVNEQEKAIVHEEQEALRIESGILSPEEEIRALRSEVAEIKALLVEARR